MLTHKHTSSHIHTHHRPDSLGHVSGGLGAVEVVDVGVAPLPQVKHTFTTNEQRPINCNEIMYTGGQSNLQLLNFFPGLRRRNNRTIAEKKKYVFKKFNLKFCC